jgi:hypothetical protein
MLIAYQTVPSDIKKVRLSSSQNKMPARFLSANNCGLSARFASGFEGHPGFSKLAITRRIIKLAGCES